MRINTGHHIWHYTRGREREREWKINALYSAIERDFVASDGGTVTRFMLIINLQTISFVIDVNDDGRSDDKRLFLICHKNEIELPNIVCSLHQE